jgi:hypothetical protein
MIVSLKGNFSTWGQTPKRLALAVVAISGLVCSAPALAANITVGSPVNGTTQDSHIWIRAHNVGCDGLTPTAFGYSIDNSSTLVRGVTKYDVDVINVPVSAGTHTIHFKSWTSNGSCPMVSTTFKVVGSSSGSSSSGSASTVTSDATAAVSSVPSYAIGTGNLDGKSWASEHDAGTNGTSRGSTVYPASTPSYDDARKFYMTYTRRAGQRWHLSFAKDASKTHFVYDTYVYITNPSQLANIELDVNQVISNGKTVIYGVQCSTYSKTWEYTVYTGGYSHWKSSNLGCNPRTWKANSWHHIQIASHRDSSGNVYYDWVNLDGGHHVFSYNKNVGGRSMGWSKGTLLINFQLDGYSSGSGSITAYIHKLTIFRW